MNQLLKIFGILLTIASLELVTCQKHHKVRHKHIRMLHLRDNHVNGIREAFDEYHFFVHKSNPKSLQVFEKKHDGDDATLAKNLEFNNKELSKQHLKVSLRLTPHASSLRDLQKESETFIRNKRVQVATTTHRTTRTTTTTHRTMIIENYDDEYEDDDITSNRGILNDDAQTSLVRPNRDNTENEHQLAEGESLTDYKLKTLGTAEGVRNGFQNELSNQQRNHGQEIFHRIRQNINRTKIEAMCRWPNKKAIAMPQSALKMFSPQKYVIHRCSDDTACCGSSDKTCVAKKIEEIVLWFHVRNAMDPPTVENLRVVNHTECECIYKNRPIMTPRPTSLPRATISTTTQSPCKCPTYFDAEMEDEICGCFCKDSREECRQRFEGNEGFTISDQRCILSNSCVQPHCLYGVYSSQNGRCPDKIAKINKGFHGTRPVRR